MWWSSSGKMGDSKGIIENVHRAVCLAGGGSVTDPSRFLVITAAKQMPFRIKSMCARQYRLALRIIGSAYPCILVYNLSSAMIS
jgi:hypothetical protein